LHGPFEIADIEAADHRSQADRFPGDLDIG
jgi:hypothetical protein